MVTGRTAVKLSPARSGSSSRCRRGWARLADRPANDLNDDQETSPQRFPERCFHRGVCYQSKERCEADLPNSSPLVAALFHVGHFCFSTLGGLAPIRRDDRTTLSPINPCEVWKREKKWTGKHSKALSTSCVGAKRDGLR